MSSKHNESKTICIIKTGATAVDWFTLRSEIYLQAEQKGLKSYIIDKSNIPSVSSLVQLLKSDEEILKKTLKKQN